MIARQPPAPAPAPVTRVQPFDLSAIPRIAARCLGPAILPHSPLATRIDTLIHERTAQ